MREETEYPEGGGVGSAFRVFAYDALGRKTQESQWEDANLTTDFTYDRFGRLTDVAPPDLSLAPTRLRYRGDQRVDRSDKVATGAGGGEAYVCTREEYDVFGRLVRVNEDRASNAEGFCDGDAARGLLTTYAYDEADRLLEVCAGPSASGCAQKRVFTYDNRGFLTDEQHPEIGPSGHGVTRYT